MNQDWTSDSASPQSGRHNLAQREASGASETLGHTDDINRARFSGRQSGVSLAILLIVFSFATCKRKEGGITAVSGGWPPPSVSPTAALVSSSADVVRVSTQYMPRSSDVEGYVFLDISPGYHINANPATYPYLIPTKLEHGTIKDVELLDKYILYPNASHKKFAFAEEPLAIYEGKVVINFPLRISWRAKGQTELPIKVRVQACDEEKCFPPATLETSMKIDLDLPRP